METILNDYLLQAKHSVKSARYGADIAIEYVNEEIKDQSYLIVTQSIPWDSIQNRFHHRAHQVYICSSLEESILEKDCDEIDSNKFLLVIGLGGGVSLDIAKYFAWRWQKELILIPSIISVDAFLSKEVGVRKDSRVRYVGSIVARDLLIDFNLIRTAPSHLNYSGVGDVLSCCTALGDWRLSHKRFDAKFDKVIYEETKALVERMISKADVIHSLSEDGIVTLVESLRGECILSELWGNARPEEGGEHFLAYALEKVSPRQYLHGSLVSLCVLVVLKLQGDDQVFDIETVQKFLDKVGVVYSPKKLNIEREKFKEALELAPKYVKEENLYLGIWNTDVWSHNDLEGILDWIYSFQS